MVKTLIAACAFAFLAACAPMGGCCNQHGGEACQCCKECPMCQKKMAGEADSECLICKKSEQNK